MLGRSDKVIQRSKQKNRDLSRIIRTRKSNRINKRSTRSVLGINLKQTNMYTSETITRPDGTKYVQCARINQEPQTWTKDQELTARAIEEFGTSA
jgi:hypothetical protein